MTIYDKTRRARSVLRAHELLAPLNPDGSFASERRGPPSPTRKGKEPDFVSFASRSDDDWADELVSTLERVMIATTEKRKANFKSKKGSGPPRRSDLVDVEDRRLWLVSQCYELVKKEREKVVSSRRGIGKPGSDGLATLQILIRATFESLEKELLDLSPSYSASPGESERVRRTGRSPNRSPTRPIEISLERRRSELRGELGISPPSGVSVKIERLKRFDDEVRHDRFKKSLDHRGLEIRGLGNKRRNLGNTLYLTDALLPELDQDEDQSVPLLPPQVSGPITLPTTDKSLRASLRRLYFPVASNPKKSGITVNSRRPYPKVKFLGRHPKPASQTASGAVPMPVPVPRPPPLPPHGQSPDSEGSPPDFIPSNPFSSDLPWLRIQTISSLSEVEDKPDLTRQAAAVLRSEFVKLGCEVSFNRIAEGVDEGFGWDFVVLCTPMGRTVKEEVVAVLERTYMRDYLWVHHLCVQRKYQASGLGTWLMERCKDMVRAKNKEGVLLFALREVVGWYGRQGFADFPTIPEREEWGGDKVMVWIKEKMQGDEAKVVDG